MSYLSIYAAFMTTVSVWLFIKWRVARFHARGLIIVSECQHIALEEMAKTITALQDDLERRSSAPARPQGELSSLENRG